MVKNENTKYFIMKDGKLSSYLALFIYTTLHGPNCLYMSNFKDIMLLYWYQIYHFSLRRGAESPILKIEERGTLGPDL